MRYAKSTVREQSERFDAAPRWALLHARTTAAHGHRCGTRSRDDMSPTPDPAASTQGTCLRFAFSLAAFHPSDTYREAAL
eukprot:1570507-Prymnesium_polylepis.1